MKNDLKQVAPGIYMKNRDKSPSAPEITPERIAELRELRESVRGYLIQVSRSDHLWMTANIQPLLDAIPALIAEIERLQAEQAALEKVHQLALADLEDAAEMRWIPVTERMPETEGRYAVIYRDGKTKRRRKFVMDYDPVDGWRNVLPPAKIKMWLDLPPDPEDTP